MRVQNIQNNNVNFNGRVAIIGKLSEIPAKCVERNRQKLSDLLYPKNFDLYLKEDAKDKFLELTAVRPKDLNNKNKPRTNYKVAFCLLSENRDDNFMMRAAQEAVEEYSKIKQPPTFKEKAAQKAGEILNRFVKIFQDADEV